jgi:branched-chain amino acid transport system permease protein
MRATAFDQEAARAQGINVGRIFSVAWAIGAVLAAVGGIFVSLYPRRTAGVDEQTAFFAFKAFPAIILGGLDSVGGAVIGGFAIGFAEAFASEYVTFDFLGAGFAGIVPYVLMLIVLLVKPYGLFGTEEIRRV